MNENTKLDAPSSVEVDALVIPRFELEKLETARVRLWDMAERAGFNAVQMNDLESITSVMWNLANRKWPSAI